MRDKNIFLVHFDLLIILLKLNTFSLCQGKRIHQELLFSNPIHAFDQDLGVNDPLRYEIVAGNEKKVFSLDSRNGSLFLEKELDLEAENGLSGNVF